MNHDEIKAVLFDLGDTILEFGKVSTTKAFLEGARTTHAFLKTSRAARGLLSLVFPPQSRAASHSSTCG